MKNTLNDGSTVTWLFLTRWSNKCFYITTNSVIFRRKIRLNPIHRSKKKKKYWNKLQAKLRKTVWLGDKRLDRLEEINISLKFNIGNTILLCSWQVFCLVAEMMSRLSLINLQLQKSCVFQAHQRALPNKLRQRNKIPKEKEKILPKNSWKFSNPFTRKTNILTSTTE